MPVELWQTYDFRGVRVMITQQWHDSFGRPMVRIESTDPHDDRSEGLPQADFLKEAAPLPTPAS